MGGNQKQNRQPSLFSIFSIFKSKKTHDSDDIGWDESVNIRRVRRSDYDKGYWVAEPEINKKASAFIAKFYESRVSDAE
ncbi:hypothetical protein AQUCO_00300288v1 [Aquilegia coerulea]|uniref:Uncharacterized protein n=1 Tax=Aquilegia coerulea TaxID=218851 RepID=A0A2G5EY46_AQUCA|nr:hypothetical protein AQUCO_00300288v1 [Aquilegia coerulea]